MPTKQHTEIHAHIGRRIRERRKCLNLNQSELAKLLGVSSYQQLQKYETGACHITAANLILFAKILKVPPNYFYEEIDLEEMIGKHIDSNIIQTRTRPFRILLAENNPGDALLFKGALSGLTQRTEVDIVHDATSVMAFLRRYHAKYNRKAPDIVVLAPSAPKLNGVEILKAMKSDPRTLELPVVILTNSINIRDVTETYKFGAAGFIQKSVEPEDYVESIAILINYWSRAVVLPACA